MLDLSVYLVTDRPLCLGRDLEKVVAAAVEGGATMVQLREKTTETRDFVIQAQRLKVLLTPLGVPLLINDRVDVALAAGADGVHVGQSDMLCEDVRRLMGPKAIIGLSIENEEQLVAAERLDVDYLGIGPVLPTSTKKDHSPPWGVEGIARARKLTRHPFVAIGSVSAANAAEVVAAGADGVAVVSALCSAQDPAASARELREAVDKGRALRARKEGLHGR